MKVRVSAGAWQLYQHCEQLRLRHPKREVYLLHRFDQNEKTVGAIFARAYHGTSSQGIGPGGATFPLLMPVTAYEDVRAEDATLLNDSGKRIHGKPGLLKGHTCRPAPAERQCGGHAEEIFIQKLPLLFASYARVHGHQGLMLPRLIELYVSRIPCGDTSRAWVFQLGEQTVALPKGCGPKLAAVARALHAIDWFITYGESYDGGPVRTSSEAALARLRALPNVQVMQLVQ